MNENENTLSSEVQDMHAEENELATETTDSLIQTESTAEYSDVDETGAEGGLNKPENEDVPEEKLSDIGEESFTEETSDIGEPSENAEPEQNDDDNQASDMTPERGESAEKYYHERYYLRYSDDERTDWLDIDSTKQFLDTIGFKGGELGQARHRKDRPDSENGIGLQMPFFCSYCGREISGVDFYRLPDGRMRCTSCSRTLVKTKEELTNIYNSVTANLDVFFGASFDTNINIEMLEERNLKHKIRHPLATVDDKSVLILGVAVNKKHKYDIYLENAAPRISLIATFAHELTHIWQYENWDNVKGFPKCPKNHRLLIYEGMAKWVEIQYLYLIGETLIAKREEDYTMSREDEYGYGFQLYRDKYPLARDAMECDYTPFTTDGYPI